MYVDGHQSSWYHGGMGVSMLHKEQARECLLLHPLPKHARNPAGDVACRKNIHNIGNFKRQDNPSSINIRQTESAGRESVGAWEKGEKKIVHNAAAHARHHAKNFACRWQQAGLWCKLSLSNTGDRPFVGSRLLPAGSSMSSSLLPKRNPSG